MIDLTGSSNGYWIHSSVIGFAGMGEGYVTLREAPNSKAKIVSRRKDVIVHPLEIRGKWVRVRGRNTKRVGWMPAAEICANPYTNCN